MLNGAKLKSIYAKIQTQLFYMIPEKWDRIYLYAAVVEKMNHLETGEMFFYYYPKGLLKKNPVNVYEVPAKFNVDENAYMKLVNQLYDTIQLLRKEFEKAEERVWTNLTISIVNLKFQIEYNYEDLQKSPYTNEERHIIWQYKYLDYPMEKLSKKERKVIENYLLQEQFENKETKNHTENMYPKNIHNIVEYNQEQVAYALPQNKKREEKEPEVVPEEKKLDKYELYKRQKEAEKHREIFNSLEIQEKIKKNQILNF